MYILPDHIPLKLPKNTHTRLKADSIPSIIPVYLPVTFWVIKYESVVVTFLN